MCVCFSIISTFHDILLWGKNVPFDASVAMVTARVFLWKERQNGNVRSLCNFSWHPGCINVKFLFLESTCSQMACVPFFTSCSLDCKLTIALKLKSGKSELLLPELELTVKSIADTSFVTCVCWLVGHGHPAFDLTVHSYHLPDASQDGDIGCL